MVLTGSSSLLAIRPTQPLYTYSFSPRRRQQEVLPVNPPYLFNVHLVCPSSTYIFFFFLSFGLLNEFFPFGPVSDAVLPICYFHFCYITFYIILPPIFRSPSDLVNVGAHSYTFFLPCCCLAYDVCVQTKLIFVL